MRLVVFANGKLEKISESSRIIIANADLIIAADGGANHCKQLNIIPDIVIGDLDSIDHELLADYTKKGLAIHRYPEQKDATDLELALDYAKSKNAVSVHIFGGLGGRWDMSLANILLLANVKYQDITITLSGPDCSMQIMHPGKNLVHGDKGQGISILPIKEEARGVTLTGFRYPLSHQTIKFGSSIGVSNIQLSETAIIEFETGILLCISQS